MSAEANDRAPAAAQAPRKARSARSQETSSTTVQREAASMVMANLEGKLARRKENQGKLEAECRQLRATLETERENSADVCAFYKKQVVEKDKTITELEDRLATFDRAQDVKRLEWEGRAAISQQEMENALAAARSQEERMQKELASLQTWKDKRTEYEKELTDLKEMLDGERRRTREAVGAVEARFAKEKAEAEAKRQEEFAKMREQMFAGALKKLDSVAKGAVVENEKLRAQIAVQDKHADQLLKDGKRLEAEVKELRQKVDMLEGLEREMAKKATAQRNLLAAKESEIADLRKAELARKEPEPLAREPTPQRSQPPSQGGQSSADSESLRAQLERAQKEIEGLKKVNEKYRGEMVSAELAREEAAAVREEMNALLDSHDQATWFILSALDDARKSSGISADPSKARLDELGVDDRQKVLEFFLTKLYTYKLVCAGAFKPDTQSSALPPIKGAMAEPRVSAESAALYSQFASPLDGSSPPNQANPQVQPCSSATGSTKSKSSAVTLP